MFFPFVAVSVANIIVSNVIFTEVPTFERSCLYMDIHLVLSQF